MLEEAHEAADAEAGEASAVAVVEGVAVDLEVADSEAEEVDEAVEQASREEVAVVHREAVVASAAEDEDEAATRRCSNSSVSSAPLLLFFAQPTLACYPLSRCHTVYITPSCLSRCSLAHCILVPIRSVLCALCSVLGARCSQPWEISGFCIRSDGPMTSEAKVVSRGLLK